MQIHDLNTKALTNPAYVAFDDGTDTYKADFKAEIDNAAASAVADADLTDNTVAFTSGDAESPTTWTAVSVLTSGLTIKVLFNRISTMIKNVRYIWNLLGSSSFSNVASTLTGAIGNTALTTTAQTLSGAIAEHERDISGLNSKTSKTYSNTPNNVIVTSYKTNKIVEVTVVQETASSWTRGQYITLATIDAEYRPSRTIPMVFYDNSATVTSEAICGVGQVGANGIVRVWLFTNITRNSSIRGTVTYILD